MKGLMKQTMKTLTISNQMMLIKENQLSLNLTKMIQIKMIHMNILIHIRTQDQTTVTMINTTMKKKNYPNQIYKNLKKAQT